MSTLIKTIFLFVLLCFASVQQASAQLKDRIMKMLTEDRDLVVLPAFFVSPETSAGFGMAAMYHFRPGGDTLSRPSNVQSVIIYTLENQVLLTIPYNIFLKNEKYWLYGELGFFIYPYRFYGIGSDISTRNYEPYSASFFRLELNALKKLSEGFYLGPTLFYDEYFKIKTEANGMLDTTNILGTDARSLLGIGTSFILDHRDNIFAPREGYYLEGRALFYEDQVIGGYQFSDFYIDARKYFHLDDQWETGFQFYHQSIFGDPPFYNLSQLGNSRIMRGYFRGAYRDFHQVALQSEIRHYLFDRVIFSAFGGLGAVADDMFGYEKLLGSYGVGLRYEINTKERIRIRLDYARGHESSGFYININEAF